VSKDTRIIFRFGAMGLLAASTFLAYLAYAYLTMNTSRTNESAPWLGTAMLFLCPGSLCFLINGGPNSTFEWVLTCIEVALVNCVLYAMIGTAYVGFWKKRAHRTASRETAA